MSAEPEHIIFIEFCITVMLKMAGIISEMVRFHCAGSSKKKLQRLLRRLFLRVRELLKVEWVKTWMMFHTEQKLEYSKCMWWAGAASSAAARQGWKRYLEHRKRYPSAEITSTFLSRRTTCRLNQSICCPHAFAWNGKNQHCWLEGRNK